MNDPFRLERFVQAQEAGGTFEAALSEVRAGRKRGHWMWFVFPQIAGLGSSPTARTYAISGLEEATDYLEHPVLGARLRECTAALTQLDERNAPAVLGGVDAMKLRSSMTLFAAADPDEPVFRRVLDQYFDGVADPATLQRLADPGGR